MHLPTLLCSCLLAVATIAPGADEAEYQQFDYQRLYELLYQFQTLPEEMTDRLAFAIRLRDRNGRTPQDLEASIHYGKRRIPLAIDLFGLLDLPVSPLLANVNAPVVTNQPADSLSMGLAIIIRNPPSHRDLDIAWLQEGMRQANAVMESRARIADHLRPQAVGVTLKFAGDTQGRVIVHGEAGEIEYRADDFNTVDLPLRPDELPERIEITDQPLVIFPLFEE